MFAVRGCGVDAWRAVGPTCNAGVCPGVAYRGFSGAVRILRTFVTGVACFVTQFATFTRRTDVVTNSSFIAVFVTVAEIGVIRTITCARTLDRLATIIVVTNFIFRTVRIIQTCLAFPTDTDTVHIVCVAVNIAGDFVPAGTFFGVTCALNAFGVTRAVGLTYARRTRHLHTIDTGLFALSALIALRTYCGVLDVIT